MPINKKKFQRAYVPTTALAKAMKFDEEMMHVYLTDKRIISAPIIWFPLLHEATPAQRKGVKVKIRFYIDPETEELHIYEHGVDEDEVTDVLEDPIYDTKAEGTSRTAIGQTQAGRYVLVIYTRAPEPKSVFVITARELRGNELKAFKRIRRRKKL